MRAITFTTLTTLAAFTLINSVAQAGFSTTSWYFNLPENSTARITDVCTTMQVPQLPNDTNGLYLWPGLSNPEQYMAQYVVASDQAFSQWCTAAYQLLPYDGSPFAAGAPANPGDLFSICYHWNATIGNMTQIGWLPETETFSSCLSFDTLAPGKYLAMSTECHGDYDAATPAYGYINTTITLSEPYPGMSAKVNHSSPETISSTDSGLNYFIPEITLDASWCTGP
ncbi:MAG: hypothetical protein Q9162_007973, partial [Coniocarpon cinnabarinum]